MHDKTKTSLEDMGPHVVCHLGENWKNALCETMEKIEKNVCGSKPDNILKLDRFVVCNLWLPYVNLKKNVQLA